MELSLSNQNWEVKGFWPWVPLKGVSMEIGDELLGVTEWLPGTVPGGVHQDLFRAGLIEDPYRDLNSLHCEWVENRWWVYRATFRWPEAKGSRVELVFKGLDYEAMVLLNGTLLGEHKGMYHPAVFDVTELASASEEAELKIVFKQAPDEMAQIGKTSETFTQKSRFNYKWDFSTRLVNVGIWDDVVIRVRQDYSLDDLYLHTDVDMNVDVNAEDGVGFGGRIGKVELSGVVRSEAESTVGKPRLTVTLADPVGAVVERWEEDVAAGSPWAVSFQVREPKLWYPNGYGAQPLYSVDVKLTDGGARLLDERRFRTGIRKLAYAKNEESPESALPYTLVVNGKKIYIKGANMTPLDHLYGNVTEAQYDWIVHLAKSANLNLLRIWGGGIIEKPYFYELCDRHGILIWQEFIQSSSGVDNIPSKRPEFLALLRQTAVTALRDRRNHVALAFWSGGNELMSAPDKPSTYEDENLAMLKELVEKHDPARLFLPTSASGPVQYITEKKGVSHDVHGHWKYQNNPYHYELYAESDNLFHSEFGVDGLSAVKSLKKFLGDKHLKVTDMLRDPVWRHHGEWWDTYERDSILFGRPPADLATFADCSQWVQAEGLRFILEANARRQFRNSGSIVWQLNEPWPNVSCTNLVDYYQELKMAYYWAKNAFEPNHASLDYRRLDYRPGERFEAGAFVHRAGEPAAYRLTAERLDTAGRTLGSWSFEGVTEKDKTVRAGVVAFDVPAEADALFFVRLRLEVEGEAEEAAPNLYTFSTREVAAYEPALRLKGAELQVEALDDWHDAAVAFGTEAGAGEGEGNRTGGAASLQERSYRVTNAGDTVALHVHAQEVSDGCWLSADRSYQTLFPGESMTVRLTCARKPEGLPFEAGEGMSAATGEPDVRFGAFGTNRA